MSEKDPFTLTVQYSQELEHILEKRFHATGRGLGDKASSLKGKLPEHICAKLRKIAALRNQAVHENTDLARENFKTFEETYRYVSQFLALPDAQLVPAGKALEQLLRVADELGAILTSKYNASGSGLHNKLSSVQSRVPYAAQGMIRKIATLRSKAAHQDPTVAFKNINDVATLDASIRRILDDPNAYQNYNRRKNHSGSYAARSDRKYSGTRQNGGSNSYSRRSSRTQTYNSTRRYVTPKSKSASKSNLKLFLIGGGILALLAVLALIKLLG